MKIAISADGKSMDATVYERFGRCPYFLIVETDDMHVEVVENDNADLQTSAGIQSASLVASKGVEAVITGNCGPKAMQVFDSTNIAMITGQHGTIQSVVERFKRSALNPSAGKKVSGGSGTTQIVPSLKSGQRGMGAGRGPGMGGGGRGMGGRGGGMGMGRRCNSPYGAVSPPARQPSGNLPREQELAQLQHQADALKQQMEAIRSRIKDLA